MLLSWRGCFCKALLPYMAASDLKIWGCVKMLSFDATPFNVCERVKYKP